MAFAPALPTPMLALEPLPAVEASSFVRIGARGKA